MKPCGPHEKFTVDKFGLVETISETTNDTALKGANQATVETADQNEFLCMDRQLQ